MRFVAQYTNYVLSISPGRKRVTEYGVDVIEEPIVAEFESGVWNQRDYETAMLAFKFRGLFQHEDEVTPVSPAARLAIYDTDEQSVLNRWSDETKAMVEMRMVESKAHGRDFVQVIEMALEPPWPAYDTFDGKTEALIVMVGDLGYDPETVLAYESSKWGQQRPDVIEGLQSAIDARDTGEVIVT